MSPESISSKQSFTLTFSLICCNSHSTGLFTVLSMVSVKLHFFPLHKHFCFCQGQASFTAFETERSNHNIQQTAWAIKFCMAKLSALAQLGCILPILKSHVNSKYTYKPVSVGLFPRGTIKFIADILSAAYNHFLRFFKWIKIKYCP